MEMEKVIEDLRAQMTQQQAEIQALQEQLTSQPRAGQQQEDIRSILQSLLQSQSANNMPTPPPSQFTFIGTEWTSWITRFEQYRDTTKLKSMPDEVQVKTLLYTMGSKANDILQAFKLTNEQQKTYVTVKEKFDAYYVAKKTKTYARAVFNQRVQKERESADDFITDLHTLAKKCEYGTLEDELIRDRIIAGMRDSELSKAIQNMETEPSLETVINRVKHSEIVDVNMSALRPTTSTHPEPEIQHIRKRTTKEPITDKTKANQTTACRKCGRQPKHKFSECPAAKTTCNNCGNKGHWNSVCRNKKINQAPKKKNIHEVDNNSYDEEFFFGSINSKVTPRMPKYITLKINNQKIKFKIDTGSSETVISPLLRKQLNLPEPEKVKERLWGPCKIELPGRGLCKNIKLSWKGRTKMTDIYILENQDMPLLGLAECEAFGIIKWHKEIMNITSDLPEDEYAKIFEGLGEMEGEYCIQIKDNAKPHAVITPRNISIPLRPKVGATLQTLCKMQIIEPVTHATEWCAPMVPVITNGKVRITIDYTELNKAVIREYHPLPTVEECLAQLAGAKVFSKIDAFKGYFQVKLRESCKDLTTFITPFGRYRCNRMPMGMTSSSEIYQRKMTMLLTGLEGCVNHVDDTLIYGKTVEEHDINLRRVLKALHEGGVTLNKEKCLFRTTECTFLGYKVSDKGIQPLDSKIQAIVKMPIPKDITALRSFIGAVNQHLRFLPNTADITKPLRDLLKKDSTREWQKEHTKAFDKIKEMLTTAPLLAHYDPKRETRVTADACKYGIGGLLEQKYGDQWKPIYFWSTTLTPTQERYAMIEKEALALTSACERFSLYLKGLKFTLRTDHKPLIPILGSKPIGELSSRLQRFRMKLTPFDYNIEHIQGKYMYTADMLSRAPISSNDKDRDILDEEEDKMTVMCIIQQLPFSSERLNGIKEIQEKDAITQRLKYYIQEGWPNCKQIEPEIKPFYEHRGNLVIIDKLLTNGNKVFIPTELRDEIMKKIHVGHIPISQAQRRANQAVWWPNMNMDIATWTAQCEACRKLKVQRPEPLIPGSVPEYPWEIIAADLCTYDGKEYLVVRDTLSNYPEVITLTSTTSNAIIIHLKNIMARHGICKILRTDNGPQFSSKEFRDFSKKWDFTHITSSPHYPQSNGASEIGVKIMKKIFSSHPDDPVLGLLNYRTTPSILGPSPSQVSMSRLLNTTLPMTDNALKPRLIDLNSYRKKLRDRRQQSKEIYDNRHRVLQLPEMKEGTKVYLPDNGLYGKVQKKREEPRSYDILTDKGNIMRKNRRDVIDLTNTVPRKNPTIENQVTAPAKLSQDSKEASIITPTQEPEVLQPEQELTKNPDDINPSIESSPGAQSVKSRISSGTKPTEEPESTTTYSRYGRRIKRKILFDI